jgi:hypothetical protein
MTTQTSVKRITSAHLNGSSHCDNGRPHVNGSLVSRPARVIRRKQTRARSKRPFHSDSSREAVLLSGSGDGADRVAIVFRGPFVELSLQARGRSLLAGEIQSELFVDGVAVPTTGDWKSACWSSDGDGDYLELQLFCSDQVRIDRQILLSRRGHFALFADAVIAAATVRIDYRLSLPVVDAVAIKAQADTRECEVGRARVFPIGLPQDRVLSTPGNCLEHKGRLDLTQVAIGRGLYLPVVFDWHPRRRRAVVDWQSLTVAELGRVVSPEAAAGHRLRMGKEQLLIYRSLAATREARSVLGQHMRYETLIGSIADGVLEPIIMVEDF